MFAGVSLNGSDGIMLRLGTSGGIDSSSGYTGMQLALTSGQGTGSNQFSTSFYVMGGWTGASYSFGGNVILTNISIDSSVVNDAVSVAINNLIAENSLLSDYNAISFINNKTENTVVIDSGSMYTTSYAASDYFAADYVGSTILTF